MLFRSGDYPPFTYREPSAGRFIGSDIDLAQSLAEHLGRRLEVVPTTWKTLSEDMQAGRFEIALGGVSITADRARLGRFSRPYLQDGKTPIVIPDVRYATDVETIHQMGGVTIKIVRQGVPLHEFESEIPLLKTTWTIQNDGTEEELHRKIKDLLNLKG